MCRLILSLSLILVKLLSQALADVTSCYVGTGSSAVTTSSSATYCYSYMNSVSSVIYGSDSGTICAYGTGVNVLTSGDNVYFVNCCSTNNCNTLATNTNAVTSCYVGTSATTKMSISSSYCIRYTSSTYKLYSFDDGTTCTSAGTSSLSVNGVSGTLYCCTSNNCNAASSLMAVERNIVFLIGSVVLSALLRASF